jgi:MoaA/NifB/PqqE/SkfB family radical SAM enzyme
MFEVGDIRHIHLELSSLCNARCPLCPRNFHGYPYNSGYNEANLSLSQLQTILPIGVVAQLDRILINGNYGDFVMNPESVDIITWLRTINPTMAIDVYTNGGARDRNFWQQLAKLNLKISFCIDGLEDTHHLYRQDTLYQQVIKNAKTYIDAGGQAIWVMTEFEHTAHQIEEARARSKELNFYHFKLRPTDRDNGPVYDRQGKKIFKLKGIDRNLPDQLTDEYIKEYQKKQNVEATHLPSTTKHISCDAKERKSIFISSEGAVIPCCWLGLAGTIPQFYSGIAELDQFQSIEKSIKIFKNIEKTFDSGQQLYACQLFCGK